MTARKPAVMKFHHASAQQPATTERPRIREQRGQLLDRWEVAPKDEAINVAADDGAGDPQNKVADKPVAAAHELTG